MTHSPAKVRVVLVVAAALVRPNGEVLLAQRPEGKAMAGLWEFPGGKVEAGERPETALSRELSEELGVAVEEAALTPLTFASHSYDDFHLLMPLYLCRTWSGDITPKENQAVGWVAPTDLFDYPAPAADLPLFEALQSLPEGQA